MTHDTIEPKNFFKRLIWKLSRRIEASTDTYFCELPGNLGWASEKWLKFHYSGIKHDTEQFDTVRNLPEDAVILYTHKYPSQFEFLLSYTRFKQEGLPLPTIGFDQRFYGYQPALKYGRMLVSRIRYLLTRFSFPDPYRRGYFRDHLMQGNAGVISLLGTDAFYQRFVKAQTDPLQYLVELQEHMVRPIYFIPQVLLFSTDPVRAHMSFLEMIFGTKDKPGWFRRQYMLYNRPDKIMLELGEPISLPDFILERSDRGDTSADIARELRHALLRETNLHRQSITGPVLKSRQEIREAILTDDGLQAFLKDHAAETGLPIHKVNKKADSYVDEIAANYSIKWIKAYDIVLSWILKNLFEGMVIDTNGLAQLKRASKQSPLILIPCHKSHLDYLILSYTFYHHQMPCPHIAAGKNLSFWPMGTIFRGGGAFFLRRTFKGKKLYAKIFSEYVKRILIEGFNVEFFIEGGRSRTGKLLNPKLGLLSILLQAYREGACTDLMFVPIFIGYDKVLEDGAYLHEIEGGKKRPESMKQIIRARKFLKKRYGKVYVNFSDPISLNTVMRQFDMERDTFTDDQLKSIATTLGDRVIHAINQSSVVTPHGIVSSALLNTHRKRITYKHLSFIMETYLSYLTHQGHELAETLVLDSEAALKQAIDTFISSKVVEYDEKHADQEMKNALFRINEPRRPNLEFYKNNTIIFFVPAAFTAVSILGFDAFQFSSADLHVTYAYLADLFKKEFMNPPDVTPEICIRKTIKAFIDDGILVPHQSIPDTYNLTSNGYKKLRLFAGFLKTYFESYKIVLTQLTSGKHRNEDAKETLKRIQTLGNRMFREEEIERAEALSKINFKNAYAVFTDKRTTSGDAALQADLEQIDQFLNQLSVS
ncbi:MAG: glycerol-3-phosphate acyltransferase [Deltaproteobacteria bacterium]|nr:MAG: glycerol-3-phosphate acyltransferase [Deltaproteobacteria bacterium]